MMPSSRLPPSDPGGGPCHETGSVDAFDASCAGCLLILDPGPVTVSVDKLDTAKWKSLCPACETTPPDRCFHPPSLINATTHLEDVHGHRESPAAAVVRIEAPARRMTCEVIRTRSRQPTLENRRDSIEMLMEQHSLLWRASRNILEYLSRLVAVADEGEIMLAACDLLRGKTKSNTTIEIWHDPAGSKDLSIQSSSSSFRKSTGILDDQPSITMMNIVKTKIPERELASAWLLFAALAMMFCARQTSTLPHVQASMTQHFPEAVLTPTGVSLLGIMVGWGAVSMRTRSLFGEFSNHLLEDPG